MQTLDPDVLLTERDQRGVVTVTLNRPKAFNALSEALLSRLHAELDALEQDTSLRAVVLAASGKAFCAGHDLKEMRANPDEAYYQDLFMQCSRMMLRLQALPVPVIAKVRGMATAAGCQLVAQCDLAVCADDAQFAVSGVRLGLFCSTPSVPVSRNLGRKQAFEMLVTGDFISAEQAQERGLVNQVVAADALDGAVEQLLKSILAKPQAALAMGKSLFYRQLEVGMEAAYRDAAQTMARNMMEACAMDGVQAFIDKKAG